MRTYATAVLCLIVATAAAAQDCETVIALSKVISGRVQDQNLVETHAATFCSQYRQSRGSSSSSEFGASYKFLAASFGSSSASVEDVASKYCSAENNSRSRSDAYREYIEAIAPGAYPAYEQCLRLSSQNLKFSLDPASVLPREFSLAAQFVGRAVGARARLGYSSSSDVTCTWNGASASSTEHALTAGMTTFLKCTRPSNAAASYVRISNLDATDEVLTIPWQQYTAEGIPVVPLQAIQSRVANLESRVAELQSGLDHAGRAVVLSGTISSSTATPFPARAVALNTLLPADPATSAIAVPVGGVYLATTTVRVCTPGSIDYVSAFVALNGSNVASVVNTARECGSAVASVAVRAVRGGHSVRTMYHQPARNFWFVHDDANAASCVGIDGDRMHDISAFGRFSRVSSMS